MKHLRVLLLIVLSLSAFADNWQTWRGKYGNGVSDETGIAANWSRTENVQWRTKLPGRAGSTPIIWEDRIFLTSVAENGDDLLLICLNTDGKVKWQQKLGTGNRNIRGNEGNSASPSPCTDGQHVWAYVSTGDIGCYDFEGNEILYGKKDFKNPSLIVKRSKDL